ncbi:galactose oxidase-like domain-containing protein [Nocardia inohanensis]|uniref:galactose oxidase-like domain-containing protein n=1 Tax=Nocardia inohanensis TaxID=209246 RepID=UPI00082E4BE9|nr:galactose oxidase-like domain-containing protein [Nocardia inohanensis]
MAGEFVAVPDWFAWENQDCGLAIGDIDGDGAPEVVVLMVDDPEGQNAGWYRMGSGFATDGSVRDWGPWQAVPDWFGWENQGAGLALADLNGNGQLDLVMFVVDNPPGQNQGYYRVGRDLAADGTVTGGWTPWLAVPDWFGWENQGADICLTRIDGQHALVVLTVDNPPGPNSGQFRLAKGFGADGTVAEWTEWVAVPDWYGWENQGAGITAADLDGDGRPELLVCAIDNPGGANSGVYTIGWGLDGSGHALDGWSGWTATPWDFVENQGAAVAFLEEPGREPELVVCAVDAPPGRNAGYLKVLELETDLMHAAHLGLWRILDFGTEINPVHAALLHTGDVLFFAGSGNDPDRHDAHEFRTRVWHYPNPGLAAPDTPIDLFCVGQAFLPDGRLLAAGGTERYDPFYGLRDALIFDPADLTWNRVPDMEFGRWYPSLATLPSGKVVAVSGLGADNFLSVVPELFDPETETWSALPVPGPIPMYGHLLLLADGRLFYTGGQYGGNNGMRPSIWDPLTGATTEVTGLTDPGSRNQSASVLLPPAQHQRVLLLGGGGFDMHSPAPALADARIVDTTAAQPAYQGVQPMDHARMHLSAVLLPDRTVLATGGSGMEEMAHAAPAHAEIFDPVTESWMHTAPCRVPRLYHSIALLTPDGKVITAGSNPARKTEELRIEIYWPPYLFQGSRPALTLSSAAADYGGVLTAVTDGPIREASLFHPGACTHSCDNEQRLIDLEYTSGTPDSLTLTMPDNPALAPPGWYLVFVVGNDGVPSIGQWLHLH